MRNKFSMMGIEISPLAIIGRTIMLFNDINPIIRAIICIAFTIDCIYESYCLFLLFRSEEYKICKI